MTPTTNAPAPSFGTRTKLGQSGDSLGAVATPFYCMNLNPFSKSRLGRIGCGEFFVLILVLHPIDPRTLQAQIGPQSIASVLAEAGRLAGAGQPQAAIHLLDSLLTIQPHNARAQLLLGNAHRGLGHLEAAKAAYQRAVLEPRVAPQAWLALFMLNADAGQRDDAFRAFVELRKGGTPDFSSVAALPSVAKLRGDPRFAVLFPDASAFEHPFLEPDARVIHEWRGETAGEEFGWIARGLGDVDGDGVTDIVVSAPGNPPYGSTRGAVYVYSGKSGKLLWKHIGEPGSLLGTGLESAGDVDGDGIADVVAGAPGANLVVVLSGRDGHELYRVRGDSVDVDLGTAVAGVGDVDGDGRADFVAGAPSSGGNGAGSGRAYLFSGRDGHRLATFDGEQSGDAFGSTVGGGGTRVIIGAAGAGPDHHGRVYVFDGTSVRPSFVKDADATGVALGYMFVSILGDVNGDGVPDIYATDFSNTAKGPATGRAYVFSGGDGTTLLTLTGDMAGEGFGIGAARTGDIDGDGRADLIVGSWQYGGAAWSGGRVQVFSSKDGRVLQTITGRVPGETLGFDAVGVGDIDGDGLTDYLVTSAWSLVNGARSGRVFLVAGTRAALPSRH